MAKKYIALILAVVILVTIFTSCSTTTESEAPTVVATNDATSVVQNDDSTFKLSFTKSDSLNPFDAVTQNNQIIGQLVFESLFDIDDNYKATLNIASSYEYTDKTTLKIALKNGITFSDGSTLDADDVIYSFNKAVKSPYWGNSLVGISSCRADSDTSVTFKLKTPNNYAHNLLSFPIISRSSDKNAFPIGSGRYYFENKDKDIVLKAKTSDGFSPRITTIHLENITSPDSIDNAINIGNISFAYRDLSRGSSKKISANKKLVNLNNLVYLGVNNKGKVTSNAYIRKAISLAVDRETLVKSSYGNFAQPATTVFNPQFELSNTALFEKTADVNAAKQAISQSGISNLSISLLVNGDNSDRLTCAKLIKQELDAVGFSVNIVVANSYDEYIKLIEKESFDLYLGETKIPNDMSMNSFFLKDGSTHFGIDTENSLTAKSYYSYLNGEIELGKFLLDFSGEMPYIPLLYRKGMICFSKAMNGDIQGTYFDCFTNIEDWYFQS